MRSPCDTHAQIAALEQAFLDYLDAWFHRRDAAAVHLRNGPRVHGFGTGVDETVYDPALVRQVVERDIAQMPNAFAYRVLSSHVTPLGPDVGLVAAEITLDTTAHQQGLKLQGLRLSMVFARTGENWQLEHMHASFPTTVHGADEPWPIKELEAREQVLQRMVDTRTRELENVRRDLERLATTDTLTGLNNRMYMDSLLRRELDRVSRGQGGLAVIILDIDHFKTINDTYGHRQGDAVLKQLASLLRQRVRDTDALGRWGGEEFLLLCPMTTLQEARQLAHSLCALLESKDFGLASPVTASFGVAAHRFGDSPEAIVDRADQAMYRAKQAGRNAVCLERL